MCGCDVREFNDPIFWFILFYSVMISVVSYVLYHHFSHFSFLYHVLILHGVPVPSPPEMASAHGRSEIAFVKCLQGL